MSVSKLKKSEKLKYCAGCRDDFYNGKNPYGISECWSLADAKVVWKKEVPIDQRPPWKQKAKKVLNCYRRPRYVYVDADREY